MADISYLARLKASLISPARFAAENTCNAHQISLDCKIVLIRTNTITDFILQCITICQFK